MQLSLKATRFVIEALDHYRDDHDRRLAAEGLSDDDASDLVNDRQFLDAIRRDLEAYQNQLLDRRDVVNSDV